MHTVNFLIRPKTKPNITAATVPPSSQRHLPVVPFGNRFFFCFTGKILLSFIHHPSKSLRFFFRCPFFFVNVDHHKGKRANRGADQPTISQPASRRSHFFGLNYCTDVRRPESAGNPSKFAINTHQMLLDDDDDDECVRVCGKRIFPSHLPICIFLCPSDQSFIHSFHPSMQFHTHTHKKNWRTPSYRVVWLLGLVPAVSLIAAAVIHFGEKRLLAPLE